MGCWAAAAGSGPRHLACRHLPAASAGRCSRMHVSAGEAAGNSACPVVLRMSCYAHLDAPTALDPPPPQVSASACQGARTGAAAGAAAQQKGCGRGDRCRQPGGMTLMLQATLADTSKPLRLICLLPVVHCCNRCNRYRWIAFCSQDASHLSWHMFAGGEQRHLHRG